MSTQHPDITAKRVSIILAAIFMLLVINSAVSGRGLFGFLNFAQEQQAPTQKQGELKDFSNENGYIELKPNGNKTVFKVGETAVIDVNISLKDKTIAGYTVPVEFNQQKYEFVGVENVDGRFNLYTKNEDGTFLILVAIQQPTNTDKISFYKTTVARLLFKATAGGRSAIDIKDKTPKGYTIKLINEKNEPYVPSFGTLEVTSR